MFGNHKNRDHMRPAKDSSGARPKRPVEWDVPVFFTILFVLSVLELGFTLDSFIYLQRKNLWWSGTERARLGFLIFSSVRTIALSAVYVGFHFAQKYFHSMFHTIFLVLSTIFWIISGVLIHHMYGFKKCGGIGKPKGGLSECHEIKIIEILAWVIAGVSVVATVPVVMGSTKRHKRKMDHKHGKTATSG